MNNLFCAIIYNTVVCRKMNVFSKQLHLAFDRDWLSVDG